MNKKMTDNQTKKLAKDLRNFVRDTQMANEYVKMCWTSLVIGEKQSKAHRHVTLGIKNSSPNTKILPGAAKPRST